MGFKCKIKFPTLICAIAILIASATAIFLILRNKNQINYSKVLVDKLSLQQQVSVKDIFAFNFSRAYVFKDSYISGEELAKAHKLNISINQVYNTHQEYIGRIVFVDESGNFVFEYQYNKNELVAIEEGMIIYPDTKIQKCEVDVNGVFSFNFVSSEYYGEG